MRLSCFTQLAVFCSVVAAIPTEGLRKSVAKDCSAEIRESVQARRANRGLSKRTFYPIMQNFNCVLTPETPKNDYMANPPQTQDIVDGQDGVSLILDIGILDVTTCQALPNAQAEVWQANSQGNYGDYLRGSTISATNGIAEFSTIFPGFASDGANHVNLLVRPTPNSSVTHIGQIFFTDPWTDVIGGSVPYSSNTHTRIRNAHDPNFVKANSGGFNAIVDIEEIHDDWPAGVVGYITVGINPSE